MKLSALQSVRTTRSNRGQNSGMSYALRPRVWYQQHCCIYYGVVFKEDFLFSLAQFSRHKLSMILARKTQKRHQHENVASAPTRLYTPLAFEQHVAAWQLEQHVAAWQLEHHTAMEAYGLPSFWVRITNIQTTTGGGCIRTSKQARCLR